MTIPTPPDLPFCYLPFAFCLLPSAFRPSCTLVPISISPQPEKGQEQPEAQLVDFHLTHIYPSSQTSNKPVVSNTQAALPVEPTHQFI